MGHSRLEPARWFSSMFLSRNMWYPVSSTHRTCSKRVCPCQHPLCLQQQHHQDPRLRVSKAPTYCALVTDRAARAVSERHRLHLHSQFSQVLSVWPWARTCLSVPRFPLLYKKWHPLLHRVFGECNARTHIESARRHLSRARHHERISSDFTFIPPDCIMSSGFWANSRRGQNSKSGSPSLHHSS